MARLLVIVGGLALVLSACGTRETDRALTGAGMGAAGGAILGPIGAATGAGIGAATGALTEPEDVDLGEPIWR